MNQICFRQTDQQTRIKGLRRDHFIICHTTPTNGNETFSVVEIIPRQSKYLIGVDTVALLPSVEGGQGERYGEADQRDDKSVTKNCSSTPDLRHQRPRQPRETGKIDLTTKATRHALICFHQKGALS